MHRKHFRKESVKVKDSELILAFGCFLIFCGITGIILGNISWMGAVLIAGGIYVIVKRDDGAKPRE